MDKVENEVSVESGNMCDVDIFVQIRRSRRTCVIDCPDQPVLELTRERRTSDFGPLCPASIGGGERSRAISFLPTKVMPVLPSYAATSSSTPIAQRPPINGHRPSGDAVARTKILFLGLRRSVSSSFIALYRASSCLGPGKRPFSRFSSIIFLQNNLSILNRL